MNKKKHVIMGIIISICLLSLASCSKSNKTNEQEKKDAVEQTEKVEDTNVKVIEKSGYVNNISSSSQEISEPLNVSLTIDAASKSIDISDTLYGLFFEDINFAADGGLYAEMVKNRSFEYKDGYAANGALHGYKTFGDCSVTVEDSSPLNENNLHYVRLSNESNAIAGITNVGFLDGMNIIQGKDYRFTVYLRSDSYRENVIVILQNTTGDIIAEGTISNITKDFVKYEVILTATGSANPATLTLALAGNGTMEADMISLFPVDTYNNRENGLRADMVEALKALNPSFLRFPGGCIVEGHPIANAYRWKDTIGDVANRPQNENLWIGTKEHPYYQSYGLGFYEYFLLCEDLDAKPVPILNAGMSCQARGSGSSLYAHDEELKEYIQDALDLIEFCNGDVTTTWGSKRVEMGHPEPFHLEYLGIGNEQWGDQYFTHYEAFREAIQAVYPEIKLITTSGPASNGDLYEFAWRKIKSHNNDATPYASLVDEHYYNSPQWFLSNVYRYDAYDRDGVDVFLGEYAAKSNTLTAAVAEAAYMTGLERNSDVVKLAAYAPLFGSLTSSQWSPDMIWFNNEIVFGSVNYYVQKMFANNVGDYIVSSNLTGNATTTKLNGKVGVGTWKTEAVFDDIKITSNETNEVLYQTSFDQGSDEWRTSSQGNFKVIEDDGNMVYTQSNNSYPTNNAIMGSASYVGNTGLSNYTLTLRAKKLSGSEGFLIPFGVIDSENFYHWNIGGWNNTLSVIEQAQGGSKTSVTETKPINITANVWYDIKVVVSSDMVECYLNDKLIHTMTVESVLPVYETTSFDEETSELIIKVVNSTSDIAPVAMNIDNATMEDKATVEILTGDRSDGVNSIFNTENIVPVMQTIDVENKFTYEAPALSVSILRLKVKK